MRRLVLCAVAALALSACTVGPDFVPPPVVAPDSFGPEPRNVRSRTTDAEPDPQWWRCFRDPELASLAERLAAQNLDLKTAAERVAQAGAERAIVASQDLPHVETQSKDYSERISKYGTASLAVPSGEPLIFSFLQQGLNASWELDLFGKVRRAYEAQTYDIEALKAAWDWVMVVVTADVARTYLDMRAEQARLAVLKKNIVVAQSGQELAQTLFDRGLTNELDVALARRQLATFQAQVAPLEAQIDASRHAIAVLLGQYPEDLAKELAKPGPIPTLPRRIPTGGPVDLLRRRPDIAEAERRVAGATARIGVAVAQLFPDVFLTGAGGGQGGIRSSHTVGAANWIGSIGPGAYWPLLDFGALDAQIEIADLTTREQLAAYKQSILTAVQQVDDATVSYRAQQESLRNLDRALTAAHLSTQLATDRYKDGLTDYLNVLDAERQQFDLQQQYVSAQQIEAESLVGLYKALGGGWQPGAAIPPLRAVEPAAIAAARYLNRAPEGVR